MNDVRTILMSNRLRHPIFIRAILTVLLVFFCLTEKNAQAEPILRKVLVLYNSEHGKSPVNNPFFRTSQSIVNYLGVLTDYWDVSRRPLPSAAVMSEYSGIVTWFYSNEMKDAKTFYKWLETHCKAGKRLLVMGQMGGTGDSADDPDLMKMIQRIYSYIGLKFEGDYTANSSVISYGYKNPHGLEFERNYPAAVPTYEKLTPVSKSVSVWLSLKRTDKPDSESSVIVTSPKGGFAKDGFIYWQEPHEPFRIQWYINPFLFFEEALGLKDFPRPDPTTLNGSRAAFSHIDGDAFSGISKTDMTSLCAEIIRDHILKKYDFPVTVSVIVGEIDPNAAGNPERVRLAREIFALDNVEPASHSYSHPFYWDPDYDRKEDYPHQYGIAIPGYVHDSKMEIDYSVEYINRELLDNKTCRLMLWSGNCEPSESDIARCDALGILNINGGVTLFDEDNYSYTQIGPLYKKIADRVQYFTGQANEMLLTNSWTGPFYGYREIIETMKNTGYPKRLKPLNIYYHFYSGEYPASLKALQDVYEWALTQEIAPMFTSEYIKTVQSWMTVRLHKIKKDAYTVEDYGDCLTIRFDIEDKVPDLAACENVIGYTQVPGGLYVSLAPEKKKAVIALTRNLSLPQRPCIRRASGRISEFTGNSTKISMTYRGFGKNGHVTIGGLKPKSVFSATGGSLRNESVRISSDDNGVVSVNGLQSGTLEMVNE